MVVFQGSYCKAINFSVKLIANGFCRPFAIFVKNKGRDGKVSSVEEMREVAGRSFQMKEYEPQPGRDWDAALQAAVEKNVCH